MLASLGDPGCRTGTVPDDRYVFWVRLWTVDVAAVGAIPSAGKVSIVSRPLGDELLTMEMEEIASAGVDVLVSLLDQDELPILGLSDEPLAATFSGVRFLHLPTVDRHPPAATEETLTLIRELAADVAAGCHVAAHCHAGHGRSPALAAAILVTLGMSPDQAIVHLSQARGRQVPHQKAQRIWVRWVADQLPQPEAQ